MRSTDIRSVPSSGSTPIDFFVGQQGVGAVVVHNASYRVLSLTLSNGIAVNIAAQRSDLVVIGQATFDGHVTLTPSILVSSQTDAGSVWVDVYLPGERVVGTYPAPCQNAMTAGNQQPRVQTVPATPGGTYVMGGTLTQGAGDLIINSGTVTSWGTQGSMRFYLYSYAVSIENLSFAAAGQVCTVLATLVVRQFNGSGAQVGVDTFFDRVVLSYFFGSTAPIYCKPLGVAPATISVIKAATAVTLAYVVVAHETAIQPLAAQVGVQVSMTADFDARDAGAVTQVPGPGNASYLGIAPSQYTGPVW